MPYRVGVCKEYPKIEVPEARPLGVEGDVVDR